MEQYIDKDVLVAEIDRRIKILQKNPYENHKTICHLDSLKQSIDTFEVKEIDLEKEIKEQSDKYYSQCEKKLQEMNDNDKDLSFLSLDNFAKYFYELGFKTQKGE